MQRPGQAKPRGPQAAAASHLEELHPQGDASFFIYLHFEFTSLDTDKISFYHTIHNTRPRGSFFTAQKVIMAT